MKLPIALIRHIIFEYCDKDIILKCIKLSPKIGFTYG